MSFELPEVNEDFKGFHVDDYNNSLADKTKFQNLISIIYSDLNYKSPGLEKASSESSMYTSEVNNLSVDSHDQLLANRLTNPLLKIPLVEHGWKREIVCRTTTNSPEVSSKRMYDVYYYSPQGKKLRSCTQIADYLGTTESKLTGDNFSYSKGVIGLSCDVEWVRDAKSKLEKSENPQSSSSNKDMVKPFPTKSVPSKPVKKIKKRRLSKVNDDEYESKKKMSKSSFEKDADTKRSKSMLSEDDLDCEWSPIIPATASGTMGNPLTCSILCPEALGCIPTLQCTSCLCLYHPQCLNIDPDLTYSKYMCTNCKKKNLDEEKELNSKKEQNSKTILKTPKSSSDQKVSVSAATAKRPIKKPFISMTSKIIPRIPVPKTMKMKTNINYNVGRPANNYTLIRPLRPLAPVLTHNNTINVPLKTNLKFKVAMQNIIQFGNKKFIAVPKKALNSIISHVPSSAMDSKKSSENQLPISNTQLYFLKNGVLQSKGSLIKSTNEKAGLNLSTNKSLCSSSRNFLSLGSSGFHILVKIFRYLPLSDLLRAAQVNQLFYAASRHYSLWKSVHLKETYVKDWEKFARCLNKNDTEVINFHKMITKTEPDDIKTMWRSINEILGKIPTLVCLDLGECAGPEITIIKQCLSLAHFTCSFNKKSLIDFYGFSAIQNLSHLYIRGLQLSKGIGLKVLNIHNLSKLEKLTHLALTSVKQNSQDTNWAMFLADMPQLEWLELGECTNFTNEFVRHALAKLVLLKHLRLEMVTEVIGNDVVNTISSMSHLDTVELINFDVKSGFEEAFCKCINLRHVLIIPTYIKQSAVTVQRMLVALSGMNHILKTVVWGLTLELMKVTEMLVTQHQFPLEPGVDCTNCVPIMPKVRLETENSPDTKKSGQVEVITVDQLRDRLAKEIPSVEVKLIKVQYVNTLSKFLPSR